MLDAVPRLHRRTALALGAVGLTAVTGCDLDPRGSGQRSPAGPSTSAEPEDLLDPDAAVVDDVVARITSVTPVVAGVPALVDLHAAHLAALEATIASPSPSTTPSATSSASPSGSAPAGAAGSVRAAERELQGFLVDAAMRAQSGALARLLASMAAGIAQHLATLPAGAR